MTRVDRAWLAAHPLPELDDATDKNGRGRVLIVGGARFVPGALRLTGEAALRAGAGKLQLATVEQAAMATGVLVPEASMTVLPADADGEISAAAARVLGEKLARCDVLVIGPGMSATEETADLVAGVLATASPDLTVVLDAAALTCARALSDVVARHEGRVIMTPHCGEMALLSGLEADAVSADPEGAASEVARRFGAVVLLKGKDSVIAAADGTLLHCLAGGVGLATGGSGDVLAGVIGGLAARGAEPLQAAAYGCWLHGTAGEQLTREIGQVGFLARELVPLVPRLLESLRSAPAREG